MPVYWRSFLCLIFELYWHKVSVTIIAPSSFSECSYCQWQMPGKKSLRFSISVTEHHDKKKWGKTSVYFSLHDLIMVHHGRKLGKKLKARIWRQNWSIDTIAGFIAMVCPASSLASRSTSPYDPGHPPSIIHQGKCPSGWRHFSIGIPHFPENYN